MKRPTKDVLRLPLAERAEIALKEAVAEAIDEHIRLGLPVYVWQNGKIIDLSKSTRHRFSKSRRRRK